MTLRVILILFLLVPTGALAQVPENLSVDPGNQEASLAWDAPTVEPQDTIPCYRVYRETASIPDDNPGDHTEKRVAEVEASGEQSLTYIDTGLENDTTYYYRVTAEVAETGDGTVTCGDSNTDESSFSNQDSATPFPPVSLQLTEPVDPVATPVEAGTPVDISVQTSNVPPDETVRLRYRQGGATTFSEVVMTADGGALSGSIPGDAVTYRGLEFVVETRNPEGDTVQVPTDGVASVRVEGETALLSQPGGSAQTAYRIISFPGRLDDPQLSNLFGSLAPYDPSDWRLFTIGAQEVTSEGGYVEKDDLSASLSSGQSLWFIRRSGGSLPSVRGTSIRTDQPFEIPLDEGWNLVGNPFAFDVPMSQVRVENTAGSLQDVFGYNGSFVPTTTADVLEPYRGYLVRLSEGQSGTLVLEPSADASASTTVVRTKRTKWEVELSAQVGQARDAVNVFGVARGATEGIDGWDGREPPPIGEYVSLSFQGDSDQRNLWRDVRPTGGSLRTWTANVQTNVSGHIIVRASGISSVPEELSVWLVDPVLDQTQNLRETPRYQLPASDKPDERTLQILVGPPAAVQQRLGDETERPERVELLPSVPHPVRSHATFRYRVPERTRATLELYDLLGRRVARLLDDESVGPGTHTYTWSRQEAGGTPSSGAYLLRLEAGGVTRTRRLVVVQ